MIQPTIASREVTQHILKKFHLRASKKLGQNFLIDANIVREIVEAAELGENDRVLEIGPGIGTLTQGLAETGAEVTAVELDKRLPDILAKTLDGYTNVRIVPGDILQTDILALMGSESFKVAANLPYYITTPIIMSLLEQHLPITDLVTMVQKEVAERMIAKPGSKTYGALSVAVQYYTEPRIVADVPPKSFIPAPEVNSVVIACKVRQEPPVKTVDEKMFFKVVRAAFGQRRKTLQNALGALGIDKAKLQEILAKVQIDGKRRGETLSLQEFADLSNEIATNDKQ